MRFQCTECDRDHACATRCPRCRTSGRQVEICHIHGSGHAARCRTCRTLVRSQTGI